MAVVREADLLVTLKRAGEQVAGVLVYGSDEARVSAAAEQVIKAIAAPEDVTRLSVGSLRSDPAQLDDALRAQSFLGGRQLVFVADVADAQVKLLETAITGMSRQNFLVLTAGSLGKNSSLRAACEASGVFFVTPIYEDRPADVLEFVVRRLKQDGLTFTEEAEERFMALCGTDRLLALNEAGKLSLYCLGQGLIAPDDVDACCGDQASYGIDGVIDAALSGDSSAADRMMYALEESDWRAVLPLLSSHVARLSALRTDADRLGGIEAALRSAKPPVFFGRKAAFAQQLKALDGDSLLRAQSAVEKCVEDSRRIPGLSNELVSRLVLSLAAEARRGLRA